MFVGEDWISQKVPLDFSVILSKPNIMEAIQTNTRTCFKKTNVH